MSRFSYSDRHAHQHSHEFHAEDATAIVEDGHIYVTEQCSHEPIIDSVTDDARDETYVETGPRCERTRETTLPATTIVAPDGTRHELADPHGVPAELTEAQVEACFSAIEGGYDINQAPQQVPVGVVDIDPWTRVELCTKGWTVIYENTTQ